MKENKKENKKQSIDSLVESVAGSNLFDQMKGVLNYASDADLSPEVLRMLLPVLGEGVKKFFESFIELCKDFGKTSQEVLKQYDNQFNLILDQMEKHKNDEHFLSEQSKNLRKLIEEKTKAIKTEKREQTVRLGLLGVFGLALVVLIKSFGSGSKNNSVNNPLAS